MRLGIFVLIFLMGSYGEAHELRVRVASVKNEIKLEAQKLKLLNYQFGPTKLLITKTKTSWNLTFLNTKLKLHLPLTPLSLKGTDLRLTHKKHKNLPDHVVIQNGEANKIDVVANLELETYIKGVVPKEMSPHWPIEALKAQAIIARSFALGRQRLSGNKTYDLDATVFDQVYEYNKEIPAKVVEAVESTKNQIMTTAEGFAFTPYYHAHCGGLTQKTEDVWGQKEFSAAIVDKYCRKEKSSWKYEISFSQLEKKLSLKHIREVKLKSPKPTKRVKNVILVTAHQNKKMDHVYGTQKLRAKLGYNKLKSSIFTVEKNNQSVVFKGVGHGHGVGLCQWGSKQMADQGFKAQKILSYYYPGSQVKHITNFKLLGSR